MAAEYELRIYNPAGTLLERVSGQGGAAGDPSQGGYLSLAYLKGVNEIGNGQFSINAESQALHSFSDDADTILDTQVEIWRRDSANDIEPYCDFYGFVRDHDFDTDDNGVIKCVAYLEEQSDLLRRGSVQYRANTADRSLFSGVATETILKNLVKYNCTASGTTGDGRDANVDAWGAFVSIAADTAAGAVQSKACMGRNVYEVLQEVANAGGLDFSLVKTAARAWQFRTAALLGTDRTTGGNAVTFSLPFGNMRRARLYSNRRMEKTVVYAAGQGVESNRTVRRRTGSNYNGTVNSYELQINASQYTTNAGLDSAADERLEELRARTALSFEVIQVPSTLYGKHYFLGDLVNGFFLGKTYTPQIKRVQVGVQASGRLIDDVRVYVD